MRFDAIEHLQRWGGTNQFPVIHDAIFEAIKTHAKGRSFCDLGSCTGLLAQRIATGIVDSRVCMVEANAASIQRGRNFGIKFPTLELRVTRSTLGQLAEFLEKNRVTVIVARRIMPELWGDDLPGGKMFSQLLRAAGVNELILEGRLETKNAVNPLGRISAENELFLGEFDLTWNCGPISYFTGR